MIRELLDWIRGRRRPKEDLQDLMCVQPEETPLMSIMRRQSLPEGHPDHLPTSPRASPPYDWLKESLPRKDVQ